MTGSTSKIAALFLRALLILILSLQVYLTVVYPKESNLALTTWIVTLAVFIFSLSLRLATDREFGVSQRLDRLLTRSYTLLLPILGSFAVLFTLNALHIAPLSSRTMKDQPDMLIPILLFASVAIFAGLVKFYSGHDPLHLGVAMCLVFAYPLYGAANLNGYGTLLVIMLAIVWYIRSGRLAWTPSALDVPLIAFLSVATLSTITSFSFFNSSLPHASIATSIGVALLIAGTTRSRRDLTRLIFALASVGLALGMLGMYKFWIVSKHFGIGFALTNRLWLPGSGPNGLAGHLVVSIPLMLSLIVARPRRWISISLAAIVAAAVACLVLSYSKGGWLGFAASILAFLLLGRQHATRKGTPKRRWPTIGIIVIVALLLAFIIPGKVGQRAVERFTDPLSLSSRAFFWRLAEHIIAEHPLIGVGMNNYYTHAKIGPTIQAGLEVDIRRSVLYHPHSTYLDIAEGTGLLGLCAYLFLLVTFVGRGVSILRFVAPGPISALMRGLIAAVIGFAVHGLFDLEFCSPEWKCGLFACMGLLVAAEKIWRNETGLELRYSRGAVKRAQILHIGCFIILVGILGAIVFSFKCDAFCPQLATTTISRNPDSLEELAEKSIQQNDFETAKSLYEKAIARRRDYPLYHEKLGWLYWLLEDTESADEHFSAAVECDPLGAIGGEHYTGLSLFLFAHGKHELARQAMASAIQTDPEILASDIWQYIPREPGEKVDWTIRREFLNLRQDNTEKPPGLSVRIAKHLKGEIGPRKTIVGPDTLEIASEIAPLNSLPVWSVKVILHTVYERYISIMTTDPLGAKKILLNLGKAYYYTGWYDEAEEFFREGIKFYRGDPNFRRALAVLYNHQREFEKAAELFAQIGDYYSEGIVWLRAKRHDRAISAFSRTIEENMTHQRDLEQATALVIMANIHKEQGNTIGLLRAKSCLERALMLSETAANHKRLSDLLYELGQENRAKEQLRKALELHHEGQPLNDDPSLTLRME
ncbi:tetratricopeptide repeat protein [bacterium]|nr:tetratricopeptide repeat protein [bacterium]